MTKYKLIKEYPGSPKIGTECTNLENDTIDAYPEFWKEVEEKDYEILSFIDKENKNIFNDIRYSTNGTQKLYYPNKSNSWVNETSPIGEYPIYSVKRLSDGEIFTIGDRVAMNKHWERNTSCIIKSFGIRSDNKLSFIIRQDDKIQSDYFLCDELYKVKQPLFTTEDGVDIVYNYEIIFALDESKFTFMSKKAVNYKNQYGYLHYFKAFSTEKAAEDYIFKNKPVLSYNDVIGALGTDKYIWVVRHLKETIKEKMK